MKRTNPPVTPPGDNCIYLPTDKVVQRPKHTRKNGGKVGGTRSGCGGGVTKSTWNAKYKACKRGWKHDKRVPKETKDGTRLFWNLIWMKNSKQMTCKDRIMMMKKRAKQVMVEFLKFPTEGWTVHGLSEDLRMATLRDCLDQKTKSVPTPPSPLRTS